MPDSFFDALPAGRQVTTEAATDGCWPGTKEAVSALVLESRREGAWKPARAGLLHAVAPIVSVHMRPAEFFLWRKQSTRLAKMLARTETPREDLGISPGRYADLGSENRTKVRRLVITKVEALACAHYLLGLDKPCTPAELSAWFWPRFGQVAPIAAWLDEEQTGFSARINGHQVRDGVRHDVVASGALIRALDWVHRIGPFNPYGDRPDPVLWPPKGDL